MGGRGGGVPEAHQENVASPADVTTSESDKPTGISPDPRAHPPEARSAPPNTPPTSLRHHILEAILVVPLQTTPRDRREDETSLDSKGTTMNPHGRDRPPSPLTRS